MATYRGNELPKPDQLDEDLKLAGRRLPGLENTEEDLGLPEEAGPDYVPRPGQKHYMETEPRARSIHDPSNDDRITELMSDPDHGTWRKEGDVGVFTPHPSFFSDVSPIQLATFFRQYGGKHQRLNLP